MEHLLVVEDDLHINNMICELLRTSGYTPTAVYSGTEAMLRLSQSDYSLMILDLMLPGKTGEEVLQEIRDNRLNNGNKNLPIIVLTAKTDKETTVKLLRLGADDYLAKPFDNDELLARIDVQLRRVVSQANENLRFKDIILDLESFDAYISEMKANLSKREFEILKLMMANPKKVFTKNNIYESVWGDEFLGDENTINVHISNLRTKLNAVNPDGEYIQTVWGIGYKMKE